MDQIFGIDDYRAYPRDLQKWAGFEGWTIDFEGVIGFVKRVNKESSGRGMQGEGS